MSEETTPTSVTAGMSRPLATRLVADQDVGPPVGERVDDPLRRAAVLDDVAVEARHAQPGERLADLAFDAFGPAAEIADPRRAARRTARRERRRPAAVVTAQRRPGLVVDERPLAVGAGLDVAAVATEDDRRRPAPVEDEDRLLAGRRVETGQGRGQRPRQQARAGRPPAPRAGRRPRRSGRRRPGGPAGRPDRTRRLARPADALDRGRRRPEDDRRAGQLGQRDRRVARLEPWRPVALVRRVVLLVDDDQPDIGQGRDDRQPRPDDDVDVAGPDPPPLVGPLALAEARVEQRDPRVEIGAEPIDERQRQGDLRGRAPAPGGRPRAPRRWPRRRSRSCRRPSRHRAGAVVGSRGGDRGPDALDGLGLGRAAGRCSAGARRAARPA